MNTKTLIQYLLLTFIITWSLAAVLIINGMNTPVFLLAVWAPGLVGIFLVWHQYGLKGLKSFFSRLTMWRMHWGWWLYLLAGFPLTIYIGAVLNGTIGDTFPFSTWYEALGAILMMLFLMGTNEEFGWRGVALPLLQRKFAPIWSGLILGVIWSAWHIPAFYIGGLPYEAWSILPYFGGVIAVSVILTPIFNSSNGSLLIAYLFHFQMMNPLFPDAHPWDTLLFVLTAIVVIFIHQQTMFKKGEGVTEVLRPNEV